jgi:hypothetical protein
VKIKEASIIYLIFDNDRTRLSVLISNITIFRQENLTNKTISCSMGLNIASLVIAVRTHYQ